MIINSITLKNFKSYEDETTFFFTPQEDRNIILIGGENGAGKSTLFEAIKLCIYGPTTYGYIGQNHNYTTKIKNCINDNAFKNKSVECFLAINLSFNDGTNKKNYYLKRTWTYEDKKIHENFEIYLDNKLLNNEDKLYFDKYLKSVLPPSLFDFFFFDGEELSDFFTGKNANSNLKESILELFNYDTFEILKKQLLSYRRANAKSNAKIDEARQNFERLSFITDNLKSDINDLNNIISSNEEYLENLIIKRSKIEEDFRNSGGLLEEEKNALHSQINKLENMRNENRQQIKDFCNDTLPFILMSNLLKDTQTQIYKEDSLNSYNIVRQKLSSQILCKVLSKYVDTKLSDDTYNGIAIDLINNMFDTSNLNNASNILDLSTDEKQVINLTINRILNKKDFLIKDILLKFENSHSINLKLKNIRENLNSTVSTNILNSYLETIHSLNDEISSIQNTIAINKATIDSKQNELANKEYHLTRVRNEYSLLLQNSNVSDISNELIKYLNDILTNLTKDKISLIEKEFIKIFSEIIRKDNYVSSIVIDDNFNSTLYINKVYTSTDVLNIIKNIGFNGLSEKYGSQFLNDLLIHYNVDNNNSLYIAIKNDISFNYMTLSTKVNINDFSNGEKQIYILSLIWAIIKSSGIEIPFIIDTPYARIDKTHRNSLTTTYLPNISKQVIILSTNKEIDNELYKIIKPYVCDEYLLLYNTELRKTQIKTGYFGV